MDEEKRRAWVSWLVLLAIALAVAVMVWTLMRPGPSGANGVGDAATRRVHRAA
jgi:hypothetical protein